MLQRIFLESDESFDKDLDRGKKVFCSSHWIVKKLKKLKLLKQQTVLVKLFKKKAQVTILFRWKNPKNNNTILVMRL